MIAANPQFATDNSSSSQPHRKDIRMKSTLRPCSIPNDRIIVQEIETETLLYDEGTHRAWCLNPGAACVWRLCDGNHTVQQIAEAASRELGSAMSEDLVLLTLAELREKDLLNEPSAALLPAGITRRAMIGRAGLAAAALLPVVAAITAPPAMAITGSAGSGDNSRTDSETDPVRKA
jgi:hypothetical protein